MKELERKFFKMAFDFHNNPLDNPEATLSLILRMEDALGQMKAMLPKPVEPPPPVVVEKKKGKK